MFLRVRDELERGLIEEAERKDLPVLGICRGLQMLNVARGGTLLQHIEGHKETDHPVRPDKKFDPRNWLAELTRKQSTSVVAE